MFFTRSVLAPAAILSFSVTTEGWVLHRNTEEHVEVKRIVADEAQHHWSWRDILGKRQSDDRVLDCPNDQFASLLSNNPDSAVVTFCNDWLNLGPATTVIEVTPTVTVTTSASETTTQTTTERILQTTTVVETATITAAPTVRRRMYAAQQIESIAASIVDSVIASGAPTSTLEATSMSPNRAAAERGLATACSCRLPQPTSTVTEFFTLPDAFTTTVGVRYLRVVQQTETRTFTSTTTVRAGATIAASATASSSVAVESSSAASEESTQPDRVGTRVVTESSASSPSDANEASTSPAITAVPIITISAVVNATATASEGAAIVTGLPVSCDDDANSKSIDQVVGGLRLGYNVYCNTGFTQDRIGRPISTNTSVEDVTSCAAQCSLLNSQGASDACQNALFVPSSEGSGGSCTLYSADEEGTSVETTPAPGSVAIVHTGTFANGDECAALGANSVSLDTSAIVASITSGGVVIATPGLVTQSSGGGESQTYVSANSTDASGYVHWSWYQVYASSASWWAVYQTSWACSATITRTIEQPATTIIEGSTITSVVVTTIIGNGFTTIISGDSTTTIGGGGGVGGPTLVPALTTSGEGGITTIFSTAAQGSTGTDGIPTPAPTPGAQGNVTVVEVFSTFFSTGTAGVIAPSASLSLNVSGSIGEEVFVSSTATTLTISGANSTFLSTGTDGVVAPTETPVVETIVSSGATTITVSGANATVVSTGDSGVIPPASTSSAVSTTSEEEEWDTSGAYGPPKTSTIVVASSEVITVTSTGASGIETPTVITAVSSETLIVEISNTTISGNSSATTFTSVATLNVTGSGSVVTPTVVTEVLTTAAGTSNFTVIIGTATANSTGGESVIPPGTTLVVTEIVNSTLPVPTPTEVISTGGVGNFSTGFETGITLSTGASGVIPPASTNATTSPPFVGSTTGGQRVGSFTRSSSINIANSTASSGIITPSLNSSITVQTPSVNTTLVLTVPLSTGFTSTIEIPIVNSSVPVTSAPAPTPTPSFNESSSIFSGSTNSEERTGSFRESSSVAVNTTSTLTLPVGTTTVEIPIVNSTLVVPPTTSAPEVSETPATLVITTTTNITLSLPSGNITLIPPTTRPLDNTTAPVPTPTGNVTTESLVSINYSTVPSFSTGNLSTILPPSSTNLTIQETPSATLNITTTPAPSATTPPVSLNSTTSGFNGTTYSGDRIGSISRPVTLSTGVSSSSNATTTPPPFPTGNSTVPLIPTAPVTEACPSPTEFSYITREVIITTSIIETIPIVASSCISSDAAPTGLNVTLAVGVNATLPTDVVTLPFFVDSTASAVEIPTATDTAPVLSELAPVASDILSAVSSIVADVTASATSDVGGEATAAAVSRFRRAGTLATQEQIDAACADSGDLVLSPTLNFQPSNATEGWFISSAFNPNIAVESVATSNGTIARFSSAFADEIAQFTQPLVLCPGTTYTLSGLTRQADLRSGCTVQFKIGNNAVFTANSLTTWSESSQQFTAGPGAEGASQDVNVVVGCAGRGGAPIGTNLAGYMVGEVGDVSVVAAPSA